MYIKIFKKELFDSAIMDVARAVLALRSDELARPRLCDIPIGLGTCVVYCCFPSYLRIVYVL